jgi:anti-anti-sigma factor
MKRQPYLAQSPEDFQRLTLGIYSARHGDTIHVRITVNLNQTNAPLVRRRVVDAIAEGATRVVLDLRHCPRIDKQGLYLLAAIAGDARRAGGGLVVEHASSELRLLFELKGVTGLLTIATDEPDNSHEPTEAAP